LKGGGIGIEVGVEFTFIYREEAVWCRFCGNVKNWVEKNRLFL